MMIYGVNLISLWIYTLSLLLLAVTVSDFRDYRQKPAFALWICEICFIIAIVVQITLEVMMRKGI